LYITSITNRCIDPHPVAVLGVNLKLYLQLTPNAIKSFICCILDAKRRRKLSLRILAHDKQMTLLELLSTFDAVDGYKYVYATKIDGKFCAGSEARFTQSFFADSYRFMSVKQIQLRFRVGHQPQEIIDYVNALPNPSLRHAKNWRSRHRDKIHDYETSPERREKKRLHARKKRAAMKQQQEQKQDAS
jgi:hypothetical protein